MFPARFHILCSVSFPSYSGVFRYRSPLPWSSSRVHYQYISTTPVYSYSLDLILLLLCHSTPVLLNLVSHLMCCVLGAPTSDFGPSRPLTLQNSFGVPATLSSTLRTHLGIHPTLVSHSCQSLVQPTCNRQVVNLPAGLVISSLPSWHVRTPVGVPFVTLVKTESTITRPLFGVGLPSPQ